MLLAGRGEEIDFGRKWQEANEASDLREMGEETSWDEGARSDGYRRSEGKPWGAEELRGEDISLSH